MKTLTIFKKDLKETLRPQRRRALDGPIMKLLFLGAAVGLTIFAVSQFFGTADTASIIDNIEITSPALYTDQGYITIQVKNNGNTGLTDLYAVVLLNDAAGGDATKCSPGIEQALITTNKAVIAKDAELPGLVQSLAPGEAVSISGGMYDLNGASVNTEGEISAATTATALSCDGDGVDTLTDRAEYIIQVTATSDDTIISKTIPVRAR